VANDALKGEFRICAHLSIVHVT